MLPSRNDQVTWIAAVAAVLFGGLNAIGIRFTVMELSPFWGATLRFAPAAFIMLILTFVFKLPMPKGRGLLGAALFGLFNFGLGYIFLYWGIKDVQPGMAQVIVALGPLLTLILAVAHRQEQFRWRAFMGALVSAGGVAFIYLDQTSGRAPVLSIIAVVLGAVCLSEGTVILRGYPKNDPITTNVVGMSVGVALHLAMSFITGEPHPLPVHTTTWMALSYLIVFGSCGLFFLIAYILKRWPASRTSYIMVLMPFVALPASALLDHEHIGLVYLAGVTLVLLGMFFGALAPQRKAQPAS